MSYLKKEINKDSSSPYLGYTPYLRKWRKIQNQTILMTYSTLAKLENTIKHQRLPNLSLADIGFVRSRIVIPGYRLNAALVQHYTRDRDFPALTATSLLGPHLRFGTISIRKIFQKAPNSGDDSFSNELVWREFFTPNIMAFPPYPK
ncbi:hypothetical protein [Nitrosomonas supralitoralis]|uniref:hypothetical protein n=1 Tax=Nitrosomonas supralitoralis TaxID=2116706 RepID=UPI0018D529EC|nr:hypothetical protein [Nitrosomonas supralitoralis]